MGQLMVPWLLTCTVPSHQGDGAHGLQRVLQEQAAAGTMLVIPCEGSASVSTGL